MRRDHAMDVLACERGGFRNEIIATITRQEIIDRTLVALPLPTDPPFIHPARSRQLL